MERDSYILSPTDYSVITHSSDLLHYRTHDCVELLNLGIWQECDHLSTYGAGEIDQRWLTSRTFMQLMSRGILIQYLLLISALVNTAAHTRDMLKHTDIEDVDLERIGTRFSGALASFLQYRMNADIYCAACNMLRVILNFGMYLSGRIYRYLFGQC